MLDPQSGSRYMGGPNIYSHSRTRTTSSNTFPVQVQTPTHLSAHPHYHQQQQQLLPQNSRRTPSVNTFSTASSIPPPAAYRTSPSDNIRRSTSSRSGGTTASAQQPQSSGYVALLRKQKATVWSDRTQLEDPRLVAAQRAAKMRATLEVLGGNQSGVGTVGPSSGRTSTGLSATNKVAAKIRHHGKPAVVGYSPGANHVGVGGVPLRLSATEVEAESSDDEAERSRSFLHHQHRRTGSSGRSSTASRRGLGYRTSGGAGGPRYSPTDTPDRASIQRPPLRLSTSQEDPSSGGDAASGRARSIASGSSAERADNVGELGQAGGGGSAARLASNSLMHAALTRENSVKSAEELKRRGSVDERTSTLTSTGRLFIANPD
ncbi:hypothetical protein SODALDRAFT_276249 [Sodiomyces alkalinus F11]|uniref:Uncharacterized protein n=1 Tax=Sodiomyces alkalinus (strain CBS 110278 / VKM F-3762 / F11) TaxID=1314773 RepID=A0A3N2PWT0_SODAK|nr:hypothetical protein SODALDRAFT_276249 [Sodiomyces alkalinus F11]ROT38958.1 hypothetical protein SODALDRAFT_276249 [Sodiomyces alkalinus F11]